MILKIYSVFITILLVFSFAGNIVFLYQGLNTQYVVSFVVALLTPLSKLLFEEIKDFQKKKKKKKKASNEASNP